MIYIGRHRSISKGIKNTILDSIHNKINTCQIFIGNSRGAALSKLTNIEKNEIKDLVTIKKFKLLCHLKYLYNLSKEFDIKAWHIRTILQELKLANEIGALIGVVHMGKAVLLEKNTATKNFIKAVKYICKYLEDNKMVIKLGLETSVSAGTELFGNKEDYSKMFNSFTNKEKTHLCCVIDTCHVFSSGENLNEEDNKYLPYIKKNIGLKYIGLIHLNNSKVPCGKKVDRHALLKDKKAFIDYNVILKWCKFGVDNKIPVILETPESTLDTPIKLVKLFSNKKKR